VTGYDVWRGPAQGPMTAIAEAAAPDFVDTTVAEGQRYAYQVRARDAGGNVSAMSNVVSVVTPRRRGALLARWRLKRVVAHRALAHGRVRIRARRWARTVITVTVGGRVAATRQVGVKRALTLRLASWSKRHRYRHRAVVVTIRRPV
jgi:hypothetical protein